MGEQVFQKRYPHSSVFFKIVEEKKKLKEVFEDMQLFSSSLEEVRDLKKILTNPTLSPVFRSDLIGKIFSDIFKAKELSLLYLQLVIKKNKAKKIHSFVKEFIDQYYEYSGIVRATVWVADDIKPETIKSINEMLSKELDKKVELTVGKRPELIGGMVIDVESKRFDASVKGKLEKVNKVLALK